MLHSSYWNIRRGALAALIAFAVMAAAVTFMVRLPPASAMSAQMADTGPDAVPFPVAADAAPVADADKPAPFGITLNASELSPPPEDEVNALADKLPATAVLPRPAHEIPSDTGDIDFPVGEQAAVAPASPIIADMPVDKAAFQASVAQNLLRKGDLRQALRYEHRAAELDPGNMLYRLDLAILYDRAGDAKGAALLYRQVVQAYGRHDATLPPALGVDNIRARAEYLSASVR